MPCTTDLLDAVLGYYKSSFPFSFGKINIETITEKKKRLITKVYTTRSFLNPNDNLHWKAGFLLNSFDL